jgi:pimeloyl-ACP methyl ester carboxylesterase
MKRKKILKRLFWSSLFIFILMNIIAFFHAYKFTHFSSSEIKKSEQPSQMSVGQKISALFFGVDLPRPENTQLPAVPFEVVKLKSKKSLEAWLMKVSNAKGTVILFHGYGGEKSSMLDKAWLFQDLGYNTFLVDFMGCGRSEGSQTTIGFKEVFDVKAAYDYLRSKGESTIILFGTSLGAVASMKAVSEFNLEIKSLIIECPFGTLLKTVKNRFKTMGVPAFPMAHLLTFWGGVQNGFNAFSHKPEEYARNIKCPTLLFYGQKDVKVSAGETDAIYNNLAGPKKLVKFPLAAHENYLRKYKVEWLNEVSEFMIK